MEKERNQARHHRMHRKNLPLRIVIIVAIFSAFEIINLLIMRAGLDTRLVGDPNRRLISTSFLVLSVIILLGAFFAVLFCLRISDEMVNRDALTQVANADKIVSFGVRKQRIGKLGQYTAIFLNIKDFKYVNELVGNLNGHQVLRSYAQTLMKLLGRKNFIGRLGGDNFMIFVQHEEAEEFLHAIEPIEIRIETEEGLKVLNLYSRCGVYPIRPKDSFNVAMNNSSIALAFARREGTKDIMYYYPALTERIMKEKRILNSYKEGLENGEFKARFQPKVCLKEAGKICGCEALAVWDRDGELIPPDVFVPILEQAGRIVDLDFYIFREACRAVKRWEEAGVPLVRVSSNFSRFHLRNPHFAEDVLKIVDECHVNTEYLEIEITESSEYENNEALLKFAAKVHARGICLSIDDFGTGRSSLSLLHSMDADVVKLDKSFLAGLNRIKDRDFLANIVHMVKALDKLVICEGVETVEQANLLRDVGCDMAQGYLYGKAFSWDEFTERLTQS